MKRKENSLLGKIKEENSLNKNLEQKSQEIQNLQNSLISNSKEAISEIEDYYLVPDTLIKKKIELIWELQNQGTYESAKQIFEILKENFDYSYPFNYEVRDKKLANGILKKGEVLETKLELNDNLKSHALRENKLHSTIKNYNEYVDFKNSVIDKNEKRKKIILGIKIGLPSLALITAVISGYPLFAIILRLIIAFVWAMIIIWIIQKFNYKPTNSKNNMALQKMRTNLEQLRSEIN